MNGDRNRRTAATVGMFDGVHLGHQAVIAQTCAIAQKRSLSPVVFTFDRHPLSIIAPEREPKSLTTVAQRADLIVEAGASGICVLRFDDYMRHLNAADFLSLLHEKYAVDCLVLGFNHRFGHDRISSFSQYQEMGASLGIEIIKAEEFIDPVIGKPISSSSIRQALSKGDLSIAEAMLGHRFCIHGHVVHGRSLGSQIGFPTANIKPYSANQQLPKIGVYAALATLPSASCVPAMVNIGNNPTISLSNTQLTIEAHLIDFDADIYGVPAELQFISRLRDEHRFPSLEALTDQLVLDRATTVAIIQSYLTK